MRPPRVARRAGWNLVDQVISSGTNAALAFIVARSVDESSFGGFAVAFTVFALLVGVSRAVATSPLGIRYADVSPEAFVGASAAAVGSAFVFGVAAGLGCLGAGAWLGGGTGGALIALGVVFPGLLVQDAWRQVFFAASRPAAAALNDGVWAILQLVAVVALLVAGVATVGPLVLAWGGAAMAAALLGVRQARSWPRPLQATRWLREHRNLTGYLVAEFGTLQGAQQGALLIIAVVGSLEAIGALRGVQVLLGPTTILAVAAFSFAVPEWSRRRTSLVLTGRQWLRGAVVLSASVAGAGICWGLFVMFAPDALGAALLGKTWAGTSDILLASIVGQAGAAVLVGPAAMLYAMDRAPVTFALNARLAPLIFIGGVGGVLLAGAEGAAWGFSIAFWAVVPLWWQRLCREGAALAAGDRHTGVALGAANRHTHGPLAHCRPSRRGGRS